MLAKMVEPFTKALDMLEAEKSAILGKKSSLFFLEVHLIFNGLLKQPPCALCLLLLLAWHYPSPPFRNACVESLQALGTSAFTSLSQQSAKVFRRSLSPRPPSPPVLNPPGSGLC